MFSLFSDRKKKVSSRVVLIIDASSWSLGASLVRIRDNSRPTVLWHKRHLLGSHIGNPQTPEYYEEELARELPHLAREALRAKKGIIEEVICFLGEPWVHGQSRVVSTSRKTSFPVTKKFLDELMEKDFRLLVQDLEKRYANHESLALLDRKTLWLALNGYVVQSFMGKRVERVDVGTYWSVVPKRMHALVTDVLAPVFHRTTIETHSLGYAGAVVSSSLLQDHTYALVSVGGLVTEIAIMEKHELAHTISIPSGAHTIFQAIGDVFGCRTYQEVASLLHMYHDEILSEKDMKKIASLMRDLSKSWLRQVEKAIGAILARGTLPATFCYAGPHLLERELMNALGGSVYLDLGASRPIVVSLGRDVAPGYVIHERASAGRSDGTSAILALFTNSIRE